MSNYEINRIKGGTDNCYLVSHGRDAILFDTDSGTSCEMVINECSKYDLKLIVLSHTHFDHAENAAVISEKFGVPVAYHEADDELFDDYDAQPLRSYGLVGFAVLQLSLKALRETNVKRPSNRFYVKDGDTLEEYGFPDIKVVELPGHTKGSIGLLVQDFALLAGDAVDNWIRPAKGHLFYDIDVMNKTYGLIHSLGDRTVYYGHGNPTKNRNESVAGIGRINMIDSMYFVKAEADQIERIVDMSVRAFETDVNVGGTKGDCPPGFDSIEWHQQMVREGHLYQAMIGKDMVGAAIVFPDETQKSVYIGRIFIDSVYHRKGYGIRLMECIESIFPFATDFNLDTPCWNERTNAFYKRLGYRIVKIEDGFNFYQKSLINRK